MKREDFYSSQQSHSGFQPQATFSQTPFDRARVGQFNQHSYSSDASLLTSKEQEASIIGSAGSQGEAIPAAAQASQQFETIVAAANGSDYSKAGTASHRTSYASDGNGLNWIAPVRQAGNAFAGISGSTVEVTEAIPQVWAANPTFNYRQVPSALEASATDLQKTGWDAETGAELLNSVAAVDSAKTITPKMQQFSDTHLQQQMNDSFNNTPWKSVDGSVASERPSRLLISDSIREDERLLAKYKLTDPGALDPSGEFKDPPRPAPSGSNDLQDKLIDVAKGYEGVREHGDNRGKQVEEFQKVDGNIGGAWCMDFAQYCIKQVEGATDAKSNILRSGKVIDVWRNAQKHGMAQSRPEPGSLAIYEWANGKHHTGIVTSVDRDGKGFNTIEGNTSNPNGSGSEGVFKKHRDMDDTVLGFVRPFGKSKSDKLLIYGDIPSGTEGASGKELNHFLRYQSGVPKYDESAKQWQQRMKDLGYQIDVDGQFGQQSQQVARQFQKANGLAVDGIVGHDTWNAAFETDKPVSSKNADLAAGNLGLALRTGTLPGAANGSGVAGRGEPDHLLKYQSGVLKYDESAKQWQQRMKDLGYQIDVDGRFGRQSQQVAHQFQKDNGLAIDGIVGHDTWNAAFGMTGAKQSPPKPSPKEKYLSSFDRAEIKHIRGNAISYDRTKAVQYAVAHAEPGHSNPNYTKLKQDCTNFVSQSLIEGGALNYNDATKETSLKRIFSPFTIDPWNSDNWNPEQRQLNHNFTVARELPAYLENHNMATITSVGPGEAAKAAIKKYLKPGDIIGFGSRGDAPGHLSLFVGYDQSGNPIAAQHTGDKVGPVKLDQVNEVIHIHDNFQGTEANASETPSPFEFLGTPPLAGK